MLRAAFAALTSQRRRMLVVSPTRKAASVPTREVGTAASSIHALLSDHGYRWGTDEAGAKVWTGLRVGEVDPTRVPYTADQPSTWCVLAIGSSSTKPAWSTCRPRTSSSSSRSSRASDWRS
nr:hypothetical protein [Microbacterium bovistercoris]